MDKTRNDTNNRTCTGSGWSWSFETVPVCRGCRANPRSLGARYPLQRRRPPGGWVGTVPDHPNPHYQTKVYVVEVDGSLLGPFAVPPGRGEQTTLHEVIGHLHNWDRNRDWFECPWCHSEVTGEEVDSTETFGHECDEVGGLARTTPAGEGGPAPHGASTPSIGVTTEDKVHRPPTPTNRRRRK